ncbi:MAG: thiol peroxidase [Candidatus Firestonebacteria bacterium]
MTERKNVVTKHGSPITLLGDEVKTGQKAPDFNLVDVKWNPVKLSDTAGKVRLLSVVPSLDTPVCDLQTQRFESEAASVPGNTVIYTISMDLPFAQDRYCSAHMIAKLKTLSDHLDASFGAAYGVLIKEMRLLSRSIFIIGADGLVKYAEYVKDISSHPDYEKALKALREISK